MGLALDSHGAIWLRRLAAARQVTSVYTTEFADS